jgi:hypothetical protein
MDRQLSGLAVSDPTRKTDTTKTADSGSSSMPVWNSKAKPEIQNTSRESPNPGKVGPTLGGRAVAWLTAHLAASVSPMTLLRHGSVSMMATPTARVRFRHHRPTGTFGGEFLVFSWAGSDALRQMNEAPDQIPWSGAYSCSPIWTRTRNLPVLSR